MSDIEGLYRQIQLSELDWLSPDRKQVADSPLPFAGAHDPTGSPARVWLDGERLCYELSPVAGTGRLTRESIRPGILAAFIRLGNGRAVLRFAERHGVLGICEHGRPYPHAGSQDGGLCRPTESLSERFCWEPVSVWLDYARQARGLLAIAVNLLKRKSSTKAAWLDVYTGQPNADEQASLPVEYGRKYEQASLSLAVDRWLAQGRPIFCHVWHEEEPALEISAGTFGILALQLAALTANKRALALCNGCGQPYFRERMPRKGYRSFCPDCGKKASDRLGKRRKRARLAAARLQTDLQTNGA